MSERIAEFDISKYFLDDLDDDKKPKGGDKQPKGSDKQPKGGDKQPKGTKRSREPEPEVGVIDEPLKQMTPEDFKELRRRALNPIVQLHFEPKSTIWKGGDLHMPECEGPFDDGFCCEQQYYRWMELFLFDNACVAETVIVGGKLVTVFPNPDSPLIYPDSQPGTTHRSFPRRKITNFFL